MKIQSSIQKILLVPLVFILSTSIAFSCSDCYPASEAFTHELKRSPLIIHAKVIQQQAKQDGYFGLIHFDGITLLEVLHSFKGRLWTDTLVHINWPTMECGSSLEGLEIGQKVILKANLTDELSFAVRPSNRKHLIISSEIDSLILQLGSQYQNIESGYCTVTTLPIVKGQIKERIYPSKQWKKYKRLRKSNPEKAEIYLEKHVNYENTHQKKSVQEVYRIIENELKRDR